MRPLPLITGLALGGLFVHERRKRQTAERFAAAALESLLKAIDANDSETGAHVRRVASYALILADAVGLADRDRRTIELASLFHDVGKIHAALFDIVHEPRTLTSAERRAIATHPTRGAEVLAPIANFHPWLADAVLAHHERWDGRGYPRGLKGRRIPIAARIVTLADTFDAITHARRYRDGRTARQCAKVIELGRGTQFDPELVDLMMLPPVFEQFTQALRSSARLGKSPPNRREARIKESVPRIRIRWRTETGPPEPVRGHLAEAKR